MFKDIRPNDYTISSFYANKYWILNNKSPYIQTLTGVKRTDPFYEDTDPRNEGVTLLDENGDPILTPCTGEIVMEEEGPYLRGVYDLIHHMYYNHDAPIHRFGVENQSNIQLDYPTQEGSSIRVIKISNSIFGERIKPNTFRLFNDLAEIAVVDDGDGNIVDENTGQHVGNIFYSNGVVVYTDEDPPDNEGQLVSGFLEGGEAEESDYSYLFQFFQVEFRNQLTMYEHEIRCAVESNEMNSSVNPSYHFKYAEMEDEKIYCAEQIENDGEDVEECIEKLNMYETLDYTPMISSVGLYDDNYELVGVGKLGRPVKKPKDIPLTFVIRFDM